VQVHDIHRWGSRLGWCSYGGIIRLRDWSSELKDSQVNIPMGRGRLVGKTISLDLERDSRRVLCEDVLSRVTMKLNP